MSRHQQYDEAQLDAKRITRYAVKVATALLERGEMPRPPRPPTPSSEVVSRGFLGIPRKTIAPGDDGGRPRFWVVGARRERGVFFVNNPGSSVGLSGWMAGDSLVLVEDGRLNYAEWREEPLNSAWTVSGFREVSDTGLMTLDYADRAQWRKVRALRGEQHREELTDHYVLAVHAPGVGLSLGLKRLLDGDGVRMDGHLTGMRQIPARP
jgi:hypothetical protein